MSIETYISETKTELKHVTWPTKQQTINFTIVVIGLSAATGLMLGLFDFISTYLLKTLIF